MNGNRNGIRNGNHRRVDRLWIGIVLGAVVVGGVVLAGPQADHANHADHAAQAGHEVYACPMHPEVVSDQPGRCPKCGMHLVLQRGASSSPTPASAPAPATAPTPAPATKTTKTAKKTAPPVTKTATMTTTTTEHAHAVYTCPMHPEIESETPGRCPKCGMDLVPKDPSATPATSASSTTTTTTTTTHTPQPGDDEVAYYTCPMHPSVKQHEPGSCPICGMDLTPVTKGAQRTGTVHVDALRRQTFGIRTSPVVKAPLSRTVRGQGTVVVDERRIVDISIQTHGWVEGLQVKETGQYVKQGATLTWLYSPPVVAAEEELLLALRTQKAMASGSAGSAEGAVRRNDALVQGARGKLRSLGLQDWQIDALHDVNDAPRRFAIVAPTAGYVVQKDVVEGAHVNDGARLFRLVSLDEVWVDAAIWARDLDALEVGQTVQVQTARGVPPVSGRIDWIYPDVDPRTQTGRVRLVMKNQGNDGLSLRPGMYVDVEVEIPLGEMVQVPADAVVQSGAKAIVFVASAAEGGADGVYVPTEVTVGARAGDVVSITAGLAPGQQVVSAGAFLIAAESRLTSSSSLWAPVAADGSAHVH